MALDITGSTIPTVHNCILAIYQDTQKRQETVVLGGMDNVRRYLWGERDSDILAMAKRPLGTFVADCFEQRAGEMSDLRVALTDSLTRDKGSNESGSLLEVLYQSDNFALRFLAVRLWEEYKKTALAYAKRFKSAEDKILLDSFTDRIEALTLPFRFSVERDILNWQRNHPKSTLHHFDSVYFKLPGGVLWAGDAGTSEYGFCTASLMPLLTYSLKGLYDGGMYFQRCKLCGELFLAKTANIPTLCSESCRREQGRRNKQKFDGQARELDYEKEHKNTYMFWMRGVKRLKRNAADQSRVVTAEQAMEVFCAEAVKRKAEVKAGIIGPQVFIGWLLQQRGVLEWIERN